MIPRSLLATALLALPTTIAAQAFTPGHILATAGGRLYELDEELNTVRSVAVPFPTNDRFDVVDVIVDARGLAHVLLTGVLIDGSIATFDPVANTWSQHRLPAFLGNISDGDLTIVGNLLFTKSQRVELPSYATTPVQLGNPTPREISAGNDGRLFAVDAASFLPGIRVVDPVTLAVVDSFSLPDRRDVRGISSLPNGELVVADWTGTFARYSADGQTLLATLTSGGSGFNDIDVSPDGRIAAGNRDGTIVVTDAAFSSVRTVDPGSGFNLQGYCCFVPPRGATVAAVEPSTGSWRNASRVSVQGRFFTSEPITAVRFSGVDATDVVVVNDNLLRCTRPAGAPGPVDVELENGTATTTLAGGFVRTPGLVAPATVAPGTTLDLSIRLERPGDFVVALIGEPASSGFTIPGIDGELLLANETILLLVPFWPAADLPLSIPVVDDPRLIGIEAPFQAASGVPGRATWTNVTTVRVSR